MRAKKKKTLPHFSAPPGRPAAAGGHPPPSSRLGQALTRALSGGAGGGAGVSAASRARRQSRARATPWPSPPHPLSHLVARVGGQLAGCVRQPARQHDVARLRVVRREAARDGGREQGRRAQGQLQPHPFASRRAPVGQGRPQAGLKGGRVGRQGRGVDADAVVGIPLGREQLGQVGGVGGGREEAAADMAGGRQGRGRRARNAGAARNIGGGGGSDLASVFFGARPRAPPPCPPPCPRPCRRRACTRSAARAAGVTPGTRPAAASVSGRARASRSTISRERPAISA
jgi:hypothetical protein